MSKFFKRIKNLDSITQNVPVLISILVEIAYKNPRSYPQCAAILSKLLYFLTTEEEKNKILESIMTKFNKIPNTGHLQVWMQRVTLFTDHSKIYEELLCRKVLDHNVIIWNCDWLNTDLQKIIEATPIIDHYIIDELTTVLESTEIDLFKTYY